MKYEILDSFRLYLEDKYTKATASTYYNRLNKLLKSQAFYLGSPNTTIESELDFDEILKEFEKIKHKNYFSQYKNALLHFCKFCNIELSQDFKSKLKLLEKTKKKKYRHLSTVEFKVIDKKLKYLKNKKLKLSFQTLIYTGLRVFELSQITPNNTIINSDSLEFNFYGKGGKEESTILYKKDCPKFFKDLTNMITTIPCCDKVFYSTRYLQDKAKELGFSCHDLRRACSKIEYKKTKSKKSVMNKLRHSSIRSTNIYLRSKVKL